MYVEEDSRGAGAGTQLAEAVIAEAKARECYKLVACSRHERVGVHQWYEKMGFKIVGKREQYYDQVKDAHVMALDKTHEEHS